MTSIRRKLLNLILISTIPLLAANIVAAVSLGNRVWRTTLEDVEAVTHLLHDFVDTTLEESIVAYLRAKVETAYNIVDSTPVSNPEDLDSADMRALSERLMELEVEQTGYLYVIDTAGRVLIHPDPELRGRVIPNVEPVRTQLERRGGYLHYSWQNTFEPSPQPKALFMQEYERYGWIISATTYRSEFAHLVDRERIADTLSSLHLNVDAYSTVVAEDGTFIAHPHHEGQRVREFFGAAESRRIMDAFFSEKEGSIRYSWSSREEARRRPKVMFFRYLPDFEWTVGTTVYLDTLRRPAVLAVLGFGGFGVLLVGTVVLLALRLSRSISDPVVRLADAAERQEQLPDPPSAQTSSREIAALATQFNGFVDRIRAQQREVEIREEHLKELLLDKTVLMQELHHRVKNNLQVIASLLSLQSQSVRDPEDAELFNRSSERVVSMALVHEQLQDEGDLSQIQLREYLQDLVGHVLRAHGAESISVTVDCDDSRLDIQRAVPCGLIVNELLTNALEHAFAEGVAGSVSVVFHEEGRTFVLSVADTGSGIRAGAKQSLGMTLVDALTRQLGGSLETSSADGTTITLRFASGS